MSSPQLSKTFAHQTVHQQVTLYKSVSIGKLLRLQIFIIFLGIDAYEIGSLLRIFYHFYATLPLLRASFMD